MFKAIPNILTTLRILLVPVFIWLFYFTPVANSYIWALVVFITAELTDYFDGYLARKYNIISNYGKVMDPLADKLLTGAAFIFIALAPHYIVDAVIVVIILLREIAITILREVYIRKKIYIPANIWGKLKTVLQMAGLTAALLYIAFFKTENDIILMVFYYYFWLVALVTIFSGAVYFIPLLFTKSEGNEL
ncbi:MAG: CDP-diacylglycerol--glycerol-3-phosphate 3-phosphatidyltransferase [Candidatus Cloacimonetes bacterium]|nr:CDP-diacylglycerol--glycerol-3-phosphate 3-phosphatidyltransferase [Candidatus Cloacimonadota bacterium]